MMHFLYSIIVGGVIGWIASLVMRTGNQMGILANIVVGIIGSWLGVWLVAGLGFGIHSGLAHLLVRIVGASLLIAILKSVRIFK
jgi:uncharacterized membrane protein YeaQ/YmgE (transglycosylase-associated protein family)